MSKVSFIDVWHSFGNITGTVTHDGETGNAAGSFFEIDFCESQAPTVNIKSNEWGSLQKLSLSIDGRSERKAFGELLIQIGQELLKPKSELGSLIEIGHEPLEDEEAPEIKGYIGESILNSWFNAIGISYLYINQYPETFAKLFRSTLKRPDFLVLMEAIGLIAVDAKNYKIYNNEYSLPLESELKRVLTFERLFRIPVWYAYLSKESGVHGSVWYWISAVKALEVGKIRVNSSKQEEFLAIDLSHFERIEKNEDLGKLYTHRLPSLNRTT